MMEVERVLSESSFGKHYRLLEMIGEYTVVFERSFARGAFSWVWECEHRRTKEHAAIKFVDKDAQREEEIDWRELDILEK